MCTQESGTAVLGYTVGLIDTLWPIAFILGMSAVFWIFRKGIRNSKARVILPYVFLALMVIFEIALFVTIFKAPFVPLCDTLLHLPLHLCATSAVLIMIFLTTRKQIILEILFIQGIVGAIVTFVFPSTASFPYEYDYWRFFLSHTILYLVPIYYFIVEGFRPNRRTLIIAFIAAHVFAAIAITMNLIIDHDYMYLNPDNERNLFHFIPIHNAIPFLGNWPGVILFGEMLVFPVYFIFYGLFRWLGKIIDQKENIL
jgi:hypothetical integral membrane protein (TIGR02206 family)